MIIDAHAHVYDVLAGYGPLGEFRPLGKGRGIWATGDVDQFALFPDDISAGLRIDVIASEMGRGDDGVHPHRRI